MRILHLLASPFFSGPAEIVAQLALAQKALGHEVSVAVDRRRTDHAAEEPAVPRFEALGLLDDGGLELSVKGPPWAGLADARKLRARAVDVVHAHFSHDHLVAALGKPKGARLVRSLHAPRSIRRLMPGADAWTVPAMRYARPLGGKRVMLLPPLVDEAFVPQPREKTGEFVAGMVSTFQPSRRHALGIDAFAELVKARPDARFVLVGDGQLEPELRAQVKAKGLENAVKFVGYQSGPDFVRHLQALDVVWILGLGNDWSGRAAAQARACGVRVIAVDEGGLPTYADDVIEPEIQAIVQATLEGERREVAMPTRAEIAQRVLGLYAP